VSVRCSSSPAPAGFAIFLHLFSPPLEQEGVGGGAATADVIAGHVTLLFDQVTGGSVELYRSGVVKALAVAAKTQLPGPDQTLPEALGAFQKAEIEKWCPIVKGANIRLQ
jgi:hypothetical protein